MDLTHRFTVPTDVEATWAHFQDIAGLAQCFPGAQLTESDETTFAGSVKVKLGPIALVYNGTGTFVEKDDAAHRFVVDAKGKDKRGNGTAGAKVTLSMAPASAGGTDVEVLTDLAVTGKPAQFGRGVMQDVSDKLLGQFVDCLEQQLVGDSAPAAAPAAAAAASAPAGAPAVEPAPASDASAPTAVVPDPAPTTELPAEPAPPRATVFDAPPTPAEPSPSVAAVSQPPAPVGTHKAPQQDDALDLGAAVLPILAKTYWKHALAVVVVVVIVVVVVKAL